MVRLETSSYYFDADDDWERSRSLERLEAFGRRAGTCRPQRRV